MYFVKKWQNDDLFKKHFAIYQCPVKSCLHEKTLEIRTTGFDETDLLRCPKCGLFDDGDKKERLLREIAILEKKINEKKEELASVDIP